jgi:chaperone modulatory protein CbpM
MAQLLQQPVDWMWLDATETVTISELSNCCGMSTLELDELIEYKALPPLPPAPSQSPLLFERLFSAEWVTPLREVGKMRHDYDLDLFTVAMLLSHLNRIEVLEKKVRSLQARLPTHWDFSLAAD